MCAFAKFIWIHFLVYNGTPTVISQVPTQHSVAVPLRFKANLVCILMFWGGMEYKHYFNIHWSELSTYRVHHDQFFLDKIFLMGIKFDSVLLYFLA